MRWFKRSVARRFLVAGAAPHQIILQPRAGDGGTRPNKKGHPGGGPVRNEPHRGRSLRAFDWHRQARELVQPGEARAGTTSPAVAAAALAPPSRARREVVESRLACDMALLHVAGQAGRRRLETRHPAASFRPMPESQFDRVGCYRFCYRTPWHGQVQTGTRQHEKPR
jgi:hypothetical protein